MYTPIDYKKKSLPARGGSETQFPGKLHDLMTYVENEGLDHIISWIRNGQAFKVHKPEKLLEILPIFFGQTKYRSFQRQLNMWHFERILQGPDKGGFMHPYFVRGNKALCAYMSRHLFDAPTVPDQMIEPTSFQQLDFADSLNYPTNMISNQLMERIPNGFNDQLDAIADQIETTPDEDPFLPLPLNDIKRDFAGFNVKKFHFLGGSGNEIEKEYYQPALEKKSSHGFFLARGQESTSLSQLLEPISPEVFESLF